MSTVSLTSFNAFEWGSKDWQLRIGRWGKCSLFSSGNHQRDFFNNFSISTTQVGVALKDLKSLKDSEFIVVWEAGGPGSFLLDYNQASILSKMVGAFPFDTSFSSFFKDATFSKENPLKIFISGTFGGFFFDLLESCGIVLNQGSNAGCHSSCLSCSGPKITNCLSCFADKYDDSSRKSCWRKSYQSGKYFNERDERSLSTCSGNLQAKITSSTACVLLTDACGSDETPFYIHQGLRCTSNCEEYEGGYQR